MRLGRGRASTARPAVTPPPDPSYQVGRDRLARRSVSQRRTHRSTLLIRCHSHMLRFLPDYPTRAGRIKNVGAGSEKSARAGPGLAQHLASEDRFDPVVARPFPVGRHLPFTDPEVKLTRLLRFGLSSAPTQAGEKRSRTQRLKAGKRMSPAAGVIRGFWQQPRQWSNLHCPEIGRNRATQTGTMQPIRWS